MMLGGYNVDMDERKAAQAVRRTTVYLPDRLFRQAKIYAARHDSNVTQLVIEGLKLRLKGQPVEEAAGD